MATIKQIASLAGVSRGTVDRVLNSRGSVNADTAQKIMDIAKALDYSPNLAGKTLAIKKKNLKFGYILLSSTKSNPFFEDVEAGIKSKAAELSQFGVTVEVRYAEIGNPRLQVAQIGELVEEGASGIVIVPINHPEVAKKLKSVTAQGVPVVTANSDIPDCGRVAYVGSNYLKTGRTAAGLLAMLCGFNARIGVVIGSKEVLCHTERVRGFTECIESAYRSMKILHTAINNDDDGESYAVTKNMLESHAEINALFLASAGVWGACRAVKELGLSGKIKIVSCDATPVNCRLINEGVIAATIDQQPLYQGSKPLDILLDYVGMDIMPEKEYFYSATEIKIKENL